jgi:hypothetical protein
MRRVVALVILFALIAVPAGAVELRVFSSGDEAAAASLTVIPINDDDVAAVVLGDELVAKGMVAFYVLIRNDSDQYLLFDPLRSVYHNVLEETRTADDPRVFEFLRRRAARIFPGWYALLFGDFVSKFQTTIAQTVKDGGLKVFYHSGSRVVAPGETIGGLVFFDFSDFIFLEETQMDGVTIKQRAFVSRVPIHDSVLSFQLITFDGCAKVVSVRLGEPATEIDFVRPSNETMEKRMLLAELPSN